MASRSRNLQTTRIQTTRFRRVLVELSAWARGRRQRVRVYGDSMAPTLAAGEFVLVDPEATPQLKDIVVASHPKQSDLTLVKRASAITADGEITLMSDNATAGTDSRSFGPVEIEAVTGVVRFSLSRLALVDAIDPTLVPTGRR